MAWDNSHWLDSLKPGDEIGVWGGASSQRLTRVASRSPRRITLEGGGRFAYPGGDGFGGEYGYLITADEWRRRSSIERLNRYRFDTATTDQLVRMAAILDESDGGS